MKTRIGASAVLALVLSACALALASADASAEAVICDPLPSDSVRLETFREDDTVQFHLYFPTQVHELEVRSATVDFLVKEPGACAACRPLKVTTLYTGDRINNDVVDVFSVAFRVPNGAVGTIDVAAHYSGVCAASMEVQMDLSAPDRWPKPLSRTDFRRVPVPGNVDKAKQD